MNGIFSLRGSAGVGERFQPASAGEFSLLRAVHWLRHRFERQMDVECYHVPFSRRLRHEQQLQHLRFHRLTFKIDDGRSVFATYYYG